MVAADIAPAPPTTSASHQVVRGSTATVPAGPHHAAVAAQAANATPIHVRRKLTLLVLLIARRLALQARAVIRIARRTLARETRRRRVAAATSEKDAVVVVSTRRSFAATAAQG